ncbi:MAG: VOC family protein [Chloracidobacterium sp.]|uniref:VOC family protein n=1 Tax=Chloracidobacterium validum TaxID=2821543 RepID=A0ABX8BFE9_9BACT|nr:VOC family protein [Chloracidobacterium validum]QUW04235.1 VOC family protein [Chloracidobacterium validum]
MREACFHLAFPATDLDATRRFYVEGLGCRLGRSSNRALILDFFGHQLVAHLVSEPPPPQSGIYPRHFGMVFANEADWQSLAARAEAQGLRFRQLPRTRFVGEPTEHRTFFLEDPSGNLLEFKHYTRAEAVFGCADLTGIGDT